MKTLITFLSKACPRVGSGNKYKVFVSLTFLVIGFLMAIPCFGQTRFEVELPSVLDVLANKATVVVTNTMPFDVEIVAMNKSLGYLKPGQSFYNREPAPFSSMDLPVLAFVYNEDMDCIGTAGMTLNLYRGRAVRWEIDLRDVDWVDGRRSFYLSNFHPVYPNPDYKGDGKKVNFPTPVLKGTMMIQIAAPTNFVAVVRINGQDRGRIEKGGFYYNQLWNLYKARGSAVIQVVFLDRGRIRGYSRNFTFHFPVSGPRAIQLVLGPEDIYRGK